MSETGNIKLNCIIIISIFFDIPEIYLLHWRKQYNFDMIILDIDFTLQKIDTLILEIDIGHVYDLAHA
jgi:hypothetical protein